jgi:outer membrane protein assembly factor BamB
MRSFHLVPMGCCLALSVIVSLRGVSRAEDRPQWGERHTRNMVSAETGLPDAFEPGRLDAAGNVDMATATNVRWAARLGKQTHGTPVIAEGRVLVGTNNDVPRDPRLTEDAGVLMCFDEKTGEFLWQLHVPKLVEIKWSDWFNVGLCASPVVENGRVYLVTNRCEVMCLDLAGMANGNDGPYQDEGRHMVPAGKPPLAPGPKDADILWVLDMYRELGVQPHNCANCSVLLVGDVLYVCTSNGADWEHLRVLNPAAPSLVAVHKKTGRLLAKDDFRIGPDITHGQWGSPSIGRVNGKDLVFFGAGNGVVYAAEALDPAALPQQPVLLKTVWKFNGQPEAQTQDVVPLEHIHDSHSYEVTANPVFYQNRLYVPLNQEPFHRMKYGWMVCLDATKAGDITRSGLLWSFKMASMTATPAIADGLVYLPDFWGKLHCLDAATGQPQWVFDVGNKVSGSPLLADGKLYLGTAGPASLWILKPGRQAQPIRQIRLPSPMYTTPVAANGTLYLATWTHLYAIGKPAKP